MIMNIIQAVNAILLRRRHKNKRKIWIHPINRNRKLQGDYYNLFKELLIDDESL